MPEGDAVRRTALRLDATMAGVLLTASDLRVPQYATVDLSGRRYLATATYGKHLFHRIEGGATVHSHLRMEGSWSVIGARERGAMARRRRAENAHTTRALLYTASGLAVGDRLGLLEVMSTDDEGRLTDRLGPDILGAAWTENDVHLVLRTLAQRWGVSGSIGAGLLDQQVVAGLGTIWVSEALHAAQVAPTLGATHVGEHELATGLAFARTTMLSGLPGQASTNPAPPRHAVYDKRGHPCRRCGTPIRTVRVGEPPRDRQLFFCPGCQRG